MMISLQNLARTVLKKVGGDVEKALPIFTKKLDAAMIDEMARDYLQRLGRGEGRRDVEAQIRGADPASITASINVREHDVRQHRRRTHEERLAAERAMLASADAVFELQIEGRAIGSIAIGELQSLKHALIDGATQTLMLGTEQARNAVLAELIEQHCRVDDTLMRVRDAIAAPMLEKLVRQANEEAPRRIAAAMQKAAAIIENRREIAA